MKRKQQITRLVVKYRLVAAAVAAGAVIVYGICAVVFHLWPLQPAPSLASTAQTTSTAPSAQDDFPGGNKPVPPTTPEPSASGTDQNGSTDSQTPDQSTWSTSKDGTSIVVYGPAQNSLFTSGSSVFGSATSDTVSYRLSDNVSGLLTSGTANVVDGKFSIKLSFTSSASAGNIEIFNQQNLYGPESNNVLIPVKFKE